MEKDVTVLTVRSYDKGFLRKLMDLFNNHTPCPENSMLLTFHEHITRDELKEMIGTTDDTTGLNQIGNQAG